MSSAISSAGIGATVETGELADGSVTYAKIQTVAANKVLGSVAGGVVEEIATTGTGSVVMAGSPTFTGAPVLAAPTATTLQTSGNVGVGVAPSGVAGEFLTITSSGAGSIIAKISSTEAAGAASSARWRSSGSTANVNLDIVAHCAGVTTSRWGQTLANWTELISGTAGNGLAIGTRSATPVLIGTNSVLGFQLDGTNPHPAYPVSDKVVTTQVDATTTTLGTVTGLTVNVTAAKKYRFRAVLFVNADATGGHKYAVAGTATATAIVYQVNSVVNASGATVISSRQTALGGAAGEASGTAYYTEINGFITVANAGTLLVQFAQNAANGTSSVLVGSTFQIVEVA